MEVDLRKKKASSSTTIAYLIFLFICAVLISSYFSSLHHLDFQNRLSIRDQIRPKILVRRTEPVQHLTKPVPPSPSPAGITCDRSHFRYDLCKINGPALLDPTTATLYSTGPAGPVTSSERVKPYPRKWERFIMAGIKEVKLKPIPTGPRRCDVHHSSPALLFSVGGYTGNFFHDVSDGLLPLFITLNSLSLTDRDVILVVDGARGWWVRKYADVIRGFTKHPIFTLQNETSTHCFKWAAVGLVSHGFMTLDPKAQPGPLTLAHFHSFLRNVFDKNLGQLHHHSPPPKGRPRLVWLGRSGLGGRAIVNQDEARAVAEEIGFDVVVYKPTKKLPLSDAYELINGSHAMIGVHGAALTHLFFLRPGSVAVQVVPLGLEWAAGECFGRAAGEVGMEYMVYKVGMNESTLTRKYKEEDPILKDPVGVQKRKGWVGEVMDVYLKEQDVKLDLARFRGYMQRVYVKAKRFMELHG